VEEAAAIMSMSKLSLKDREELFNRLLIKGKEDQIFEQKLWLLN
jgi:hypothetical protein